ncbi:hypothetical protein DASB73_040590 [Starmerella bacillaris]|uniref:Uncharacterized protein n=1 Tax=Starmerella bacillaris TaxID=1247836 RepID=A0AAV5RR57_STABA|nr:hypothetical protein DASB73_040590 [Starmerella bacillaris]
MFLSVIFPLFLGAHCLSDLAEECPNYEKYSKVAHKPFSDGKLRLPFQRPPKECRTFISDAVENKLEEVKSQIYNEDVARLWENSFPNTLDTTIKFHRSGESPLTFVVTGDIDAEWIRDSHRQLSPYLTVLKEMPKQQRVKDPLSDLMRGAIALHAQYLKVSPHCNAFQAPPEANIMHFRSNTRDRVYPPVNPTFAFECKYELDSLASFYGLANSYFEATHDLSFMTDNFLEAIAKTLKFLQSTMVGTFDDEGHQQLHPYEFQRSTDIGSETQWNKGVGNPVRYTGMARSWFRPSDDATIFQFFVPANAQMAVELNKLSVFLQGSLGNLASKLSKSIATGIWEHGVVEHAKFGKVFAYEVDGYGSSIMMDDANMPSLLSLPLTGFVSDNDPTYLRTRAMIMDLKSNPYYIKGQYFEGIGGPHVGVRNAWPMSRIIAMRTTDDVDEIRGHLKSVMAVAKDLGLIHESVNVDTKDYTRSWFAWANSEFANSILDLQNRGLLKTVTENL